MSALTSPGTDVSSLSLEAKVGQLFVAGFDGTTPTAHIEELITKHHLGGVIYFDRNAESPSQLRGLSTALQGCVPDGTPPLLIAIDQEGGRVARLSWGTELPSAMTFGGADDAALSVSGGRAVGRELRALGISLNLAPVLDINNPDNPVIGVRSFGEHPATVTQLGTAFADGLREGGVMACGKHFPGHGGTVVDSHFDLPVVDRDRSHLDDIELRPFRAAIDAGIGALMTAHVAFPAVTDEPECPATLSECVISDLLRTELGFEGLVMTDCMEMDAIAGGVGTPEGAVRAVAAGCDLITVSHTPTTQRTAIDAVVEAVRSGRISGERVDESARRVLRTKRAYNTGHVGTPDDWESAAAECRSVRQTAAEQGVTLVRDGCVPLPDEPIAVYEFSDDLGSPAEGSRDRNDSFASILSATGLTVNAEALDTGETPLPTERPTVVCTANAADNPHQAAVVRDLIEAGVEPVVVATRSPYDLSLFPGVKTCLATYGDTRPALVAAATVLAGETEPTGHLPITIPNAKP